LTKFSSVFHNLHCSKQQMSAIRTKIFTRRLCHLCCKASRSAYYNINYIGPESSKAPYP
jgi:hypothetical protein